MSIGTYTRQATLWQSQHNPDALYVQATDGDTDGLSIGANVLSLNSGTVQDIDGYNAALGHGTHAGTDDPACKVNGSTDNAPTVRAVVLNSTSQERRHLRRRKGHLSRGRILRSRDGDGHATTGAVGRGVHPPGGLFLYKRTLVALSLRYAGRGQRHRQGRVDARGVDLHHDDVGDRTDRDGRRVEDRDAQDDQTTLGHIMTGVARRTSERPPCG